MSVFDDLITKLSEKNLSDAEVDEILKAGEAYASVIGENEEILEGLSRLKLSVLDKKSNKDIKSIDNYEDLNAMFDDYMAKKEKNPNVINHSREADMAYKMHNLASIGKMSPEEILSFSEKLMTTGCATYGSEEDKSLFRDSIVASYEICGYQSVQQRKMGDNVNKLDAEISGRPYIPEPHVDLYSRPTANEPDHNNIADSFKEDATSYEAGKGLFDRFKERIKTAADNNMKNVKGHFKDLGSFLDEGLSKHPKRAMAAGLVAMIAGMETFNPPLAAAGASILTAAAVKYYNEKIKGKVADRSEDVENAKDVQNDKSNEKTNASPSAKKTAGITGKVEEGNALLIHSIGECRND